MTVGEMIQELQKHPQDAPLLFEYNNDTVVCAMPMFHAVMEVRQQKVVPWTDEIYAEYYPIGTATEPVITAVVLLEGE